MSFLGSLKEPVDMGGGVYHFECPHAFEVITEKR
jgi:hypothetical protein